MGHHRWFCNQFSPFFPVLHCPLGLAELQACPFPDVVFPPLPLSALSSSPFHCDLQDGFGHTWWTGNMTIPLQFASLYYRQEVFVWSNCLLDLGTDCLVGNMVFVWDVLSLGHSSWQSPLSNRIERRISVDVEVFCVHTTGWHCYSFFITYPKEMKNGTVLVCRTQVQSGFGIKRGCGWGSNEFSPRLPPLPPLSNPKHTPTFTDDTGFKVLTTK